MGFEVFTVQPFDKAQRWVELRIASSDTRFVLFKFDAQGLQPGMMFNGALACDKVERTYDELVERGVDFVTPPEKTTLGNVRRFQRLGRQPICPILAIIGCE